MRRRYNFERFDKTTRISNGKLCWECRSPQSELLIADISFSNDTYQYMVTKFPQYQYMADELRNIVTFLDELNEQEKAKR